MYKFVVAILHLDTGPEILSFFVTEALQVYVVALMLSLPSFYYIQGSGRGQKGAGHSRRPAQVKPADYCTICSWRSGQQL